MIFACVGESGGGCHIRGWRDQLRPFVRLVLGYLLGTRKRRKLLNELSVCSSYLLPRTKVPKAYWLHTIAAFSMPPGFLGRAQRHIFLLPVVLTEVAWWYSAARWANLGWVQDSITHESDTSMGMAGRPGLVGTLD